jgi:hypothetical protein
MSCTKEAVVSSDFRGHEPAWIAIDPGPHTGIAVWFPDTKVLQLKTFDFGIQSEMVYMDLPHIALWTWLEENVQPYDHLVVEKFEYDRDKARNSPHINYDAAEYVGVVKLWAEMRNVSDFCYQTRQAVGRNAFWSDDKLRRLGFWKTGKEHKHEMDALRHLLYHYSFCKKLEDFLYKVKDA